jgi:hypothetical protein
MFSERETVVELPWAACGCQVNCAFDWLPLAALVEGRILAMHGGIGKHVETVEQIRRVVRPQSGQRE